MYSMFYCAKLRLQRDAACCSVLQRVAACCSVTMQCHNTLCRPTNKIETRSSVQCAGACFTCCSALQYVLALRHSKQGPTTYHQSNCHTHRHTVAICQHRGRSPDHPCPDSDSPFERARLQDCPRTPSRLRKFLKSQHPSPFL